MRKMSASTKFLHISIRKVKGRILIPVNKKIVCPGHGIVNNRWQIKNGFNGDYLTPEYEVQGKWIFRADVLFGKFKTWLIQRNHGKLLVASDSALDTTEMRVRKKQWQALTSSKCLSTSLVKEEIFFSMLGPCQTDLSAPFKSAD